MIQHEITWSRAVTILEGGSQVVALGMVARGVTSSRMKMLRSSKAQSRLSICLMVGCASAPRPSAERVKKESILTILKNRTRRSEGENRIQKERMD